MKTNYEKSNSIESVKLSKFRGNEYKNLLSCSDSEKARLTASKELVDYLCGKLNIPCVTINVLKRSQPHSTGYSGNLKSKTFGTYTVNRNVITIYNLTAIKKNPVSIKVFADTLLHEFMHHYDYTVLGLSDSIHSAGFYKRISDLKNKLG